MTAEMTFEGGNESFRNDRTHSRYGFRVTMRPVGGQKAYGAAPHDGLKGYAFQSAKMGDVAPMPPPGTPRTPAPYEEGGRILGPVGKSVRRAGLSSRVRTSGCAALDNRHALPAKTTIFMRKGELPFDVVLF
jgi:hypothetical protein